MYYGGIAGITIGILLILVLSRIFAKQRQRLRDEINGKK